MYDTTEELMAEIAAGEDTFLEFKEVVFKGNQVRFAREEGKAQQKLAEVFASMANTEGGVVVFGVNDDREPIGIDEQKQDAFEQWIVNICRDLTRPSLSPILDWAYLTDTTGTPRLCLKVTIPKDVYSVVWTWDQRPLKRVGSHRQPILPDELARLMARRSLIMPFEERSVMGTAVEDLRVDLYEAYYLRRFKASCAERGTTALETMQRMKLLRADDDGAMRPTVLGMLLFGEKPQEDLPQAYIDLVSYESPTADGNASDSKIIEGRLLDQVQAVLQYFKTSPQIAKRSTKDGAGRLDAQAYSMIALQEALVNAVVHRDYEIAGSQIQVYLFPDRIEFRNPGGLHNTLTVEDLYAGCHGVRRNQLLAGFFRDYKSPVTDRSFMEARGEGFINIVRECEKLGARKPELRVVGQSVRLTLFSSDSEE